MKKIFLLLALMILQLNSLGYCGPQEYMEAGYDYAVEREFEKAIQEFQKVVDNYPDDPLAPEALLAIGTAYMSLEEIKNANDIAKHIIDTYSNSEQAKHSYFLLGGNYLVLKDTDTAIHWLEQRVEKYPTPSNATAKAYFYLGEAYHRKGSYEEALDRFEYLKDNYPESPYVKTKSVNERIADCLQRLDRVVESIGHYKIAYSIGSPEIFRKDMMAFQIGWLYEYLEDYANAIDWYQEVLDEYPDSWYVSHANKQIKEIENK